MDVCELHGGALTKQINILLANKLGKGLIRDKRLSVCEWPPVEVVLFMVLCVRKWNNEPSPVKCAFKMVASRLDLSNLTFCESVPVSL